MYLFTRRTRLAPGHGTAGVDWARSVAGKALELTGQELQVWGSVYSPGVGTISWTGWFPSFEALEKVGDVLQADASMEKLTNAGTRYTEGGFDDGLLQPVSGSAGGAFEYVCGTGAVAAAGGYARAVAAGIEIAQRSEAITGCPTTFCRSVSGRAGAVKWLNPYESAAQMEAAQRELTDDRSWIELLDSTRGCFAADRGITTGIYRRLG
jgi:hypothetical protein